VVGDLSEALGPVVASPGENLHGFIGKVDLHPVTVELDLVYPTFAAGAFVDRCSECRLNEARMVRLDAAGCRFLALEGHRSSQPQRKLPVPLMTLNKILDGGRQVPKLQIASASQLMSNVL
jgi:hypothetical protein